MVKKEGRRLTIKYNKGGYERPWIKDYKPSPEYWEVIYYSNEQEKVKYEIYYTYEEAVKRKHEIKEGGYKEKRNVTICLEIVYKGF